MAYIQDLKRHEYKVLWGKVHVELKEECVDDPCPSEEPFSTPNRSSDSTTNPHGSRTGLVQKDLKRMYTENRFDFTSEEDSVITEHILAPIGYELKEGSGDLIQQVFISHFCTSPEGPSRHPLQIARRCKELI